MKTFASYVENIPAKMLWTDTSSGGSMRALYLVKIDGKETEIKASNDLCAMRNSLFLLCSKVNPNIKLVGEMNQVLSEKFGVTTSAEKLDFPKIAKILIANKVQVIRIEGDGTTKVNILTNQIVK